jgi:hypothetical protein
MFARNRRPLQGRKFSETQQYWKNNKHFTSLKKLIWTYLPQACLQLRQELPMFFHMSLKNNKLIVGKAGMQDNTENNQAGSQPATPASKPGISIQ